MSRSRVSERLPVVPNGGVQVEDVTAVRTGECGCRADGRRHRAAKLTDARRLRRNAAGSD